jgi:uncharacterized membrane protein YbhN (UPF0104 family)
MFEAQPHDRISRRNLILLAIFLIGLYVLLPQVGKFSASLHILKQVQLNWLLVAFAALFSMYASSAEMYTLLAKHRLRYVRTLWIQMASLFTNRLAPAGIGAIGINYAYLRKNKHSRASAASVVTVNNTLGFIGNVILVAIAAIQTSSVLHISISLSRTELIIISALVLCGITSVLWLRHAPKVIKGLKSTLQNIASYRDHPLRILSSLICSMLLTSFHALCLYACAHALGVHVSVFQALVSLTIEVAGATLTPTPGGLGGAEASLAAALVIFGFTATDGLAVALLFRLLTYWFALGLGSVVFVVTEKRAYF